MTQVLNETNCVIKPDYDIVAAKIADFKMEVESKLHKDVKELAVDLQDVDMIDSVGLGVLISTHNKLKATGGQLKVVNLSEDIFALFRTMRLNQHFVVVPSKDSE